MADLRFQYDEGGCGAGHPTEEDTLNRLLLAEADVDGKGLVRRQKEQASPPATSAGELVIFAQEIGGQACLLIRPESGGTPLQITQGSGWA